MKICFSRPNTIITNEETEWKLFIISNQEVSESACEINKFFADYFPWRSEFAYACLSNQLAFESKLLVLSQIKLIVNSLKNRSTNHGQVNFGKSAQVASDTDKGSTLRLRNKLKTRSLKNLKPRFFNSFALTKT